MILIDHSHNYANNYTNNNPDYDPYNYTYHNNNYYNNSETSHFSSICLSGTSWAIPVSGQLYFILRLLISRKLHCSSMSLFCNFKTFEIVYVLTFTFEELSGRSSIWSIDAILWPSLKCFWMQFWSRSVFKGKIIFSLRCLDSGNKNALFFFL